MAEITNVRNSSAPRRVLFLAPQPFFQWRGSPIRVGFDVQALAEMGYEVDLLTLPVGEDRAIPGVRVLRVANPFGVKNIPIGPSLHKAFFDLLMLFKGVPLARRQRYAVVHAVEETALVGWVLARLCGAKLVFEKHSDPASHKAHALKNLILWLYARAERLAIRLSDAVIATGAGLVEQARRVAPRKPVHHIFDIPSSLVEPDERDAHAVRARLKQHADEVLVLYVGSFAVYQGIDLMFESMPEVLSRTPRVRFAIVGGTEAEIADRRAWLAARGIDGSVRFLGKIPPDQLPHTLAAADILLSPRISGINTPLKLLDYLKAGRAIVATDNTANRQILNEQCAVLTRPEAKAFAAGVVDLVNDAPLRAVMGRAGRRLVDDLYNFGEFKRRLQACYTALG